MNQEKPRRRILNIIRRMAQGNDFYTNDSPRISKAEIEEINSLDYNLWLQKEHTYGASAGPIAVYPLHRDKFIKQAQTILESQDKHSKRSGV